MIDAKKAPVEKTARVIETLETLIALKKNIQCRAIISPTLIRWKNDFPGMRHGFLVTKT